MNQIQPRDWIKINPESKYAGHMKGSYEVVCLYENNMVKVRNSITSFVIPVSDCIVVKEMCNVHGDPEEV